MTANLLQQLPLGLSCCHRLEELRLHDNELKAAAFPEAFSALSRLTCEWDAVLLVHMLSCLLFAVAECAMHCTADLKGFRCVAVLELDRNWLEAVPGCLLNMPLRKLSLLTNPVRHLPGENLVASTPAAVAITRLPTTRLCMGNA
jgi:hypothetical protein